MKYEEAPKPEPKENEILVRVIAAGVNPVDGMIRSGMFAKYEKATFPMIPGADIAGAPVGIFGKRVRRDTMLGDGDRIELYRRLIADPKARRRRRSTSPP